MMNDTSAPSSASASIAPPSTAASSSSNNTQQNHRPSTTASSSSSSSPPTPWEPRSINLYKRENMQLIGEGTFGSVWLARAPNGTKVALKKIRKEKKEGFPITAIREIKLLKALKHPNIVSLKDVVSSHMPGKEGDVLMVFEFLDHDLTGLLESKVPLSDAIIKYYLKSILEGLAYLHSRSVLHRDIKGANILVSNNGDVKIADLGLARGMAKGGYTNRVVTLWYRAPELLLGSCDYDAKIDTWSVGCLFAELLTRGTVLFPGNSTELDQLNKIYHICGTPDEQSWPGVSKLKYFKQFTPKPQKRVLKAMFASQRSTHAVDLLDRLLSLNPTERLSAEQALEHEYFVEEPRPIEPHQHPTFLGNHHEFGSKQKRRAPAAGAAAGGGQGGQQHQRPQQLQQHNQQQQRGGGGYNQHQQPYPHPAAGGGRPGYNNQQPQAHSTASSSSSTSSHPPHPHNNAPSQQQHPQGGGYRPQQQQGGGYSQQQPQHQRGGGGGQQGYGNYGGH